MLLQITQICSYESDYITKHSDMNIMTENCAEITQKLLQRWRTMSKTCVKQCYRLATLYRGRGRILNLLFKIPIIFCHRLCEIYEKKKKKAEVWCMLLQITQICFYESDYVMQHSEMSIMIENCAKIRHKLPQY